MYMAGIYGPASALLQHPTSYAGIALTSPASHKVHFIAMISYEIRGRIGFTQFHLGFLLCQALFRLPRYS